MNFYPHHIGDFNNSTRHLTRVERSVYRDAIELYYDTEQALTSDTSRLERRLMCATKEEKEALSYIKDEFFIESTEGFKHARCEEEIEKYRANIGAKAKAGIASAAARKLNKAKLEQDSTPVKVSSTPVHNQEPRTINQEPRTINQEPVKTLVPQQATKPVDEIFNHWREVMNHPRARMDGKRKKLISDALKMQYTVDDLKMAITGCSKTPHNMGQNDNGQRYDGLHIILKSADQIDRFIQNAKEPPPPPKPNGGGSTRFPDSYEDKVYKGTPIEDLPWLMEAMAEEDAKEAAEAENAKH